MRFLIALGLGFVTSAASAQTASSSPPDDVCPRLAAMGDAALFAERGEPLVTARDAMDEIQRIPEAARASACTRQAVAALVRTLAHHRILADEARRRGVEARPDIRRELDLILSRAVSRAELSRTPAASFTEAQVRAYYEAHLAEYTRPARVKVLAIWVEDEATAARVQRGLERASERKFRQLSARYSSDRRLRSRRGELGWLSADSASTDPAIVTVALSMERVGATTREAIRTAEGDYVWLRIVEMAAPEPFPFDQVRATIASRMRTEAERARLDALVEALMRSRGIEARLPAELRP